MKIKIKFARNDGEWYEYKIDDYEIIEEDKKIEQVKSVSSDWSWDNGLIMNKLNELVDFANRQMEKK